MSLTTDDVIDDLGGTKATSDGLGLSLSTVSSWRERGIPPRRWPDIVRLADEKGKSHITFEALAAVEPVEVRT